MKVVENIEIQDAEPGVERLVCPTLICEVGEGVDEYGDRPHFRDMYEEELQKVFVALCLIGADDAKRRQEEEKTDAHAARVLAYHLFKPAVFEVKPEVVKHDINAKYALDAGGGFWVENGGVAVLAWLQCQHRYKQNQSEKQVHFTPRENL